MKVKYLILAMIIITSYTTIIVNANKEYDVNELESLIMEKERELSLLKEEYQLVIGIDKNTIIGKELVLEDFNVTISKIYFTDERYPGKEWDHDNVLVFEYQIQNNKDSVFPAGHELDIYVDDVAADLYPRPREVENIASGKKGNLVSAYAFNGDYSKIEFTIKEGFHIGDKYYDFYEITDEELVNINW